MLFGTRNKIQMITLKLGIIYYFCYYPTFVPATFYQWRFSDDYDQHRLEMPINAALYIL